MAFKPSVNVFGFEYFIIILLLVVAFAVSLYVNSRKKKNDSELLSKAKILDKAYLDNKVKMYVVEYETKKFIIIENGNAITISEPIKE